MELKEYETSTLIQMREEINKELKERRKLIPKPKLKYIRFEGVVTSIFSVGYDVKYEGDKYLDSIRLSSSRNLIKWNKNTKPIIGDKVVLEYKERRNDKDNIWSLWNAKIINVIR